MPDQTADDSRARMRSIAPGTRFRERTGKRRTVEIVERRTDREFAASAPSYDVKVVSSDDPAHVGKVTRASGAKLIHAWEQLPSQG